MPAPFDVILVMCGATGVLMVIGAILLLYRGVIKLAETSAASALEAQFKDQIRVNIRNPALGLFAIGFFFFALAFYFAQRREGVPLVITGHIKIADIEGIYAKLKSPETNIAVSSDGEIFLTLQPLEKLQIEIDAPGYRPQRWVHTLTPDEARSGRVQIAIPEFLPAAGIILNSPRSGDR